MPNGRLGQALTMKNEVSVNETEINHVSIFTINRAVRLKFALG